MDTTSRLLEGTRVAEKAVHEIVIGDRTPISDFLGDLTDPDLAEFYAEFEKICSTSAWVQMGQWFKPMQHASNVWQVASPNYRLLGFRHTQSLVLTNWFRKNKKDDQRQEIAESERLQGEFKKTLAKKKG